MTKRRPVPPSQDATRDTTFRSPKTADGLNAFEPVKSIAATFDHTQTCNQIAISWRNLTLAAGLGALAALMFKGKSAWEFHNGSPDATNQGPCVQRTAETGCLQIRNAAEEFSLCHPFPSPPQPNRVRCKIASVSYGIVPWSCRRTANLRLDSMPDKLQWSDNASEDLGLPRDAQTVGDPLDPAAIRGIHLASLSVSGLRGIDQIEIPRLGRVTLLAGKNGVGKTTILEAIRIYATRGQYGVLDEIVTGRDEFIHGLEEDGSQIVLPAFSALFTGHETRGGAVIEIGPVDGNSSNKLKITASNLDSQQESLMLELDPAWIAEERERILTVSVQNHEWPVALFLVNGRTRSNGTALSSSEMKSQHQCLNPSRFRRPMRFEKNTRLRQLMSRKSLPPAVECLFLGPGLLSNEMLSRLWDNVALTDDERYAVEALELIAGRSVERVAMIVNHRTQYRESGPYAMVRFTDQEPVTLRSLGSGALRAFGFAVALANSRSGFLLIDEVENGIHYSDQHDFWRMVFTLAGEKNAQVIATTHSWDCIKGFARASLDYRQADSALVRLERRHGKLRSVEYSRDQLKTAAEQNIEVR